MIIDSLCLNVFHVPAEVEKPLPSSLPERTRSAGPPSVVFPVPLFSTSSKPRINTNERFERPFAFSFLRFWINIFDFS